MKSITITVIAGLTLVAGAASASAEGFYAGGQLGIGDGGGEIENSGFDTELSAGSVIGGFIGKDLGNQIRVEGELTYRQNDVDSIAGVSIPGVDVSSVALMANAFYDFDTGAGGSGFTPYLGLGVGVVHVEMAGGGDSASGTAPALQVMAGGSFPVGEKLAMTVDLRALGASPTLDDGAGFSFEQDYTVATAMVGLRRSF